MSKAMSTKVGAGGRIDIFLDSFLMYAIKASLKIISGVKLVSFYHTTTCQTSDITSRNIVLARMWSFLSKFTN